MSRSVDGLRALDARLVPRAAAVLRRGLDRAAVRRSRLRSTAGGPLALLRDVPQLGLLLLAVLVLAGSGVALALGRGETAAPPASPSPATALPLELGPPTGADPEDHLAAAGDRLAQLVAEGGDGRHLALVSLRAGLTPDATGALLDATGVELARGYLQAPVPGRPELVVFQTPGDPVAGLREAYDGLAVRKTSEQGELAAAAAGLGPDEQEARAVFTADAVTAGAEAAAYGSGCACVVALVVEGEPGRLADLAAAPDVRGVEPAAPRAELADLDVRPLVPAAQEPS